MRKSDEAQYICKATNSAGSAEVRTILYVTAGESPQAVLFRCAVLFTNIIQVSKCPQLV